MSGQPVVLYSTEGLWHIVIFMMFVAACACDATGTVDTSTPCERELGQCQCKNGVDGRQCNQCQRMYVDFSDTGCTGMWTSWIYILMVIL